MATGTRALPTAPELAALRLIDDLRVRQGLSQADLAARVGISQPQLSRALRGERTMTVTEMALAAAALDVKLSDLLRAAGL